MIDREQRGERTVQAELPEDARGLPGTPPDQIPTTAAGKREDSSCPNSPIFDTPTAAPTTGGDSSFSDDQLADGDGHSLGKAHPLLLSVLCSYHFLRFEH